MTIQVNFSKAELGVLHSLVRRRIEARKRRKDKSGFVPEPGHRDMELRHIQLLEGMQRKIAEALGPDFKKGG